jgi:hypothetical protein
MVIVWVTDEVKVVSSVSVLVESTCVYDVLVSVAVSVVRIVVCAADVVTVCVFVTFVKAVLVRVRVVVRACVLVTVVVTGTVVRIDVIDVDWVD